MTDVTDWSDLAAQRDRQIQLGLVLTALWLGAGALYVTGTLGWGNFLRMPLGDLGDFLGGAFAPLAFLWLVLGLFLQQRELGANNRAIQRQYEIMQRTAEHAELQSRAIAANELHARQDTFIDVAQLVMNQLEVIAGMLFMSSQGSPGDGVVTDSEMDVMFARLSSGELSVFSRRMIMLRVRLEDPQAAWSLFYGTPIRRQHCDNFIHSFERLLRSAAGCDPEGMIVDALHGNAQGRLYRVMCELRDAPPPVAAPIDLEVPLSGENTGVMDVCRRMLPRFLIRALLVAGLALLRSLPAFAETGPGDDLREQLPPVPSILPGLEEILVTAPEPRYVAPTTRDRIGRIWAPVSINGTGPYRLVLDTGASRSAITQQVANELGLPILADAFRLRGVTGSSIASAVKIDTLEFGELLIENTTVPIVADAFGGAQGVLGGEGLNEKRIVIEFRRDQISIARSRRQPPPPGYSIVPFKYSPARGMRVNVQVGSIKAVAIIDTGGEVTIGNLALREALSRRRGQHDEFEDVIIGITEDIQKTARVRIPSIVAGEMIVRNAEINFGDMHIFEHWRLDKRPALLLGMDVLGTLDTLIIDYRRGELQLKIER